MKNYDKNTQSSIVVVLLLETGSTNVRHKQQIAGVENW